MGHFFRHVFLWLTLAVWVPPAALAQTCARPGSFEEVENTDLVGQAITRLQAEGLATDIEEKVDCCFAVQDKVWVSGPDTTRWEVYTVLADSPAMKAAAEGPDGAVCCAPAADAAPVVAAAGGCCGEPAAAPVVEPVTMGAPAGRCC